MFEKAYRIESNLQKRTLPVRTWRQDISQLYAWLADHRGDPALVGGAVAVAQAMHLQTCPKVQAGASGLAGDKCMKDARSVVFSMRKMLDLKLRGLHNLLWIAFAGMMIYLVLLVYFVRWLMEYLVRKHAMVDRDTQLFSRKYFETALELHVAMAHRKKESLSLICFSSLAKNGAEGAEQIRVLRDFAKILRSTKRKSDVACRYDHDIVVAILPDTSAEEAKILQHRLNRELEENHLNKIEFGIVELQPQEKCGAFVGRLLQGCGR